MVKNIEKKWRWLRAQAGFQKAPVLITFRMILWAIRCSLRRDVKVKLRRWNLKMFLPARWRGVEKLIFVFREDYEAELTFLDCVLSPGKTFVDVGANLGIYALVASRLVGPSGRVIAFEPSLWSFLQLQRNVTLNRLKNVDVSPMALSTNAGKAFLYHGSDPGQNSLGRDPHLEPKGEVVVTQSLDNALAQASVERVDVIKIDVEGAEELVVHGANKAVTSHRPIIIFEVNQEACSRLGLSHHGTQDLLRGVGYKFFTVWDKTLCEVKSLPSLGNLVAIYEPLE